MRADDGAEPGASWGTAHTLLLPFQEDAMHHLTEIRQLPIRRRSILTGDGACTSHPTVFCPQRDESVTTGTCAHCPRLIALDARATAGSVTCELPARSRNVPDVGEAAARIAVGELTRRDFTAVTDDVEVETLTSMLAGDKVACVAVVDAKGGVVGIVSKTDIVRQGADGDVAVVQEPPRELGRGFHIETRTGTTAGDVMTRGVYCLPEDARLSHAIGLMAVERIAHLPVVDAAGALVGVLHGDDVIAWLARQIGYVDAGSSP